MYVIQEKRYAREKTENGKYNILQKKNYDEIHSTQKTTIVQTETENTKK